MSQLGKCLRNRPGNRRWPPQTRRQVVILSFAIYGPTQALVGQSGRRHLPPQSLVAVRLLTTGSLYRTVCHGLQPVISLGASPSTSSFSPRRVGSAAHPYPPAERLSPDPRSHSHSSR